MSRNHFPELNAILFQLLDELEAYASQVERLGKECQQRADLMLFGEPGKSMDRMRMLAAAIPQVSAQWVMVMISHTELMHDLWRVTKGEARDMAAEVEDHLACVAAMRSRCRHLLAQGGHVLH